MKDGKKKLCVRSGGYEDIMHGVTDLTMGEGVALFCADLIGCIGSLQFSCIGWC